MSRISPDVLLDLHDKFPGRSDDECTYPARLIIRVAAHQPRQNWPNKRGRLPRPCLRNPDNIVTCQHFGNRCYLDWCRLGVTRFLDGFVDLRSELEGAEGHRAGLSPVCRVIPT